MNSRLIRGASVLAVLLLSAACQNYGYQQPVLFTQGVSVVEQAEDRVQRSRITVIEVKGRTAEANPHVAEALTETFKRVMPTCTDGVLPTKLEIFVRSYTGGSAGAAFLVGDEAQMTAGLVLRETLSNNVVGRYSSHELFRAGGLLGAAGMAAAHRTMSQNMAENFCKEVFGVDVGYKAGD